MFCMGSFCGKFHDELQGDSDDEDENDNLDGGKDSTMRGPGKKKFQSKKTAKTQQKKEDKVGGGSSYMRWSPFLNQITVKVTLKRGEEASQQVVRLQVVNKSDIPANMMNSISQLTGVHTIELIRCEREDIPPKLSEMDTLAVLRMSHNLITKFPDELARVQRIERIILDWNKITVVPRGIFTHKSFLNLQVLNLAHNKISMLPADFGITASESQLKVPQSQLKYIDLSYNSIPLLPDNVPLYCINLEVLNMSHNCLKKLPSNFKLEKLQRLFVSFNELTELPSNIGTCLKLAKIRIISNQIRELPPSVLQLWKKNNGHLEELLPDRNPLIMPSITTFEMAATNEHAIDQAFQLFSNYLEDQAAEEANNKLALRDAEDVGEVLQLEDKKFPPEVYVSARSEAHQEDKSNPRQENDTGHSEQDYYFGFLHSDQARIADIRNSESTILLLKKRLYVEAQQAKAREEQALCGEPREDLKMFLEPDFVPEAYRGRVPVSSLDLTFILMTLSSKTFFSSCHLLFDKFENGDKGYMTREEWSEFCLSSMLSLLGDKEQDSHGATAVAGTGDKPEDEDAEEKRKRQALKALKPADRLGPEEQMWSLMAWRRYDQVLLNDFIAAFHIHDIDKRDPWIGRCANVLKMDYYEMNFKELKRRLRAKNNFDAAPDLDFSEDLADNSQLTRVLLDDSTPLDALLNPEGTLRSKEVVPSMVEVPHAKEIKDKISRGDELMKRVALSGPEHVMYEQIFAHGDLETASISSDFMSEESDGDDEGTFDAQVYMQQHREQMTQRQQSLFGSKLIASSDAGIKKLMDLRPSDFFGRSKYGVANAEGSGKIVGVNPVHAKKTHKGKVQHIQQDDPKMKTDVFAVRQALRMVYRNMPYQDFSALISFLLRGLVLIRHSPADSVTYWHADDPTFKLTMGASGSNSYTRVLLQQMGFVVLHNIYWVWPSVHLDPVLRGGNPGWGDNEVPPTCPGVDSERLGDMITLLRSCQRALHVQGTRFTGHFQTLDE